MGVLYTQKYKCANRECLKDSAATKTFLSTDPDVLGQLPMFVRNQFPLLLTKGSACTRTYAECVTRDQVNGALIGLRRTHLSDMLEAV